MKFRMEHNQIRYISRKGNFLHLIKNFFYFSMTFPFQLCSVSRSVFLKERTIETVERLNIQITLAPCSCVPNLTAFSMLCNKVK